MGDDSACLLCGQSLEAHATLHHVFQRDIADLQPKTAVVEHRRAPADARIAMALTRLLTILLEKKLIDSEDFVFVMRGRELGTGRDGAGSGDDPDLSDRSGESGD